MGRPASRTLSVLAAAVPALLLSAQFAWVLAAPLEGGNRQWAVNGVALMLMEFFMVHAGFMSLAVFGADGRARLGMAAGLFGLYLLFVAGFGYALGSFGIAASAAALLAGRFYAAAVAGREHMGERIASSVFGVVAYMAAVIGTSAPDAFPAFGYTPEVFADLRPEFGSSQGLWIDEPHRPVAAGTAYFLAIGLFELARLRRAAR